MRNPDDYACMFRACSWRGSIYGSAATIVPHAAGGNVGGSVCGRRQRTKNSRLTGEAGQPCRAWNHDFNKSIGSFLTRVQVSNSNDAARMLKRGVGIAEGGRGDVYLQSQRRRGGARGQWNWCHKEATRSDEGGGRLTGCRMRWDWFGLVLADARNESDRASDDVPEESDENVMERGGTSVDGMLGGAQAKMSGLQTR